MNITVVVTESCNFRCDYCYNDFSSKILKKDVAMKIVNYINEKILEPFTIEFIGGEPLLNFPVIQFIVDLLSNNKFFMSFYITTNGSIYDESIVDFFLKYSGKSTLVISYDAPSSVHDLHRKNINKKPTSSLVKENLVKYLSLIPNLIISMRFMEDYNKTIMGIEELYKMGVKYIDIRPIDYEKYDPHLQFEIYQKIFNYYIDNFLLQGRNLFVIKFFEADFVQGKKCGAVCNTLTFGVDASIYPCYLFSTANLYKLGKCSINKNSLAKFEQDISSFIVSGKCEDYFCYADYCLQKKDYVCFSNENKNVFAYHFFDKLMEIIPMNKDKVHPELYKRWWFLSKRASRGVVNNV